MKTPFQMLPLQKKRKQNKIVSNLNKPDEINESTVINLQTISSPARRNTATPAIFCKHLKEVKDSSWLVLVKL